MTTRGTGHVARGSPVTPHVEHVVEDAGAAQPLAPGPVGPPAVAAVGVGLGLRPANTKQREEEA